MKFWTVYDAATGEVVKTLLAPINHLPSTEAGQAIIEGQYEDDKYFIKDGRPVARDVVQSPSGKEVSKPLSSEEIRLLRDKMLSQTDWTQIADAPVDKGAWAIYRQALRDIPQQEGFPDDVHWPPRP